MVAFYHFTGLNFADVRTYSYYALYNWGYFVGLIFAVRLSSKKTMKIGPLENFPLYSIHLIQNIHLIPIWCMHLLWCSHKDKAHLTCIPRILAPFNHIKLILLCCQFAVTVADHRDCGQVEQCVTYPQGNVWCSLFNNASTNHLAIMKTIIINENISSATIDDENVKIYWNTHSQDIFLTVQSYHN